MRIRKAVIPAAGLGTRFLPASRSIPKPMLPVFDTPALHLTVEEAVRAGINQIVIVVSEHQETINAYFGRIPDLEAALEKMEEAELLQRMHAISEMADISYIRQQRQLGLGDAVLATRELIGKEPFAVLLPDDIIWDETPTITRMSELFVKHGSITISVKEVPDESIPSLGIIKPCNVDGRVYEIADMVEKPSLAKAPSNLAIIGRYLLTPQIFDALETVQPDARGEIQLTDAISVLLRSQKAYAYRFPGYHIDAGTPLGLLKTSFYAALQRENISAELRSWTTDVLEIYR
jgi:UTP--glucose-1-phosphate uridylyltransferase